jgi:hypothetical protein
MRNQLNGAVKKEQTKSIAIALNRGMKKPIPERCRFKK